MSFFTVLPSTANLNRTVNFFCRAKFSLIRGFFVFIAFILSSLSVLAQPVWQSGNSNAGSSSSASVTKPTGVTAGDLLILSVGYETGTGLSTITPPSGWNLIRRSDNSSNFGIVVYWKIATATEVSASSYSVSLSNSVKWSAGVSRITGHHPTFPITSGTASANWTVSGTSSTTLTAPAVTTTAANQMVMAFYGIKKSATFTSTAITGSPTNGSERYDVQADPPSHALYTYVPTTVGTTNTRAATASTSELWIAGQIIITSATEAYPIIAGTASSQSIDNVTSHTVSLPANIEANDLLLLVWTDRDNTSTLSTPSGWTSLYNVLSGSNQRYAAFYKVASGTEGSTITLTTSASERSAHVVYRIEKNSYTGVPVAATAATGSSTAPDPPSLTSGFGAVEALWIATAHMIGNTPSSISAPTDFTDLVSGYTGTTGTSHATTSTAVRPFSGATLNPGAFSIGTSGSWAANTIAIRGLPKYTVSGEITGDIKTGVKLRLIDTDTQTAIDSVTTTSNGLYSFTLSSGSNVSVVPSLVGYSFSPSSRTYSSLSSNQTSQNFASTALSSFTISGTITNGSTAVSGVTVTMTGSTTGTTTTNSSGEYTFTAYIGDTVTITPSRAGFTVSPEPRTYSNLSANQTDQDYYIIPEFPVIESTATYTTDNSSTTNHAVNMPSGIQSGDLLLMIFRPADTETASTPSGWTLLDSRSSSGTTYVWYKNASGSESSTTTVTTNGGIRASAITYRISSWQGTPEIAFAGSNTNNPPSLTPSWGSSVSSLYISALTNRRSDSSVSGAPSNYSDLLTIAPPSSSNNTRSRVSTAHRNLKASPEDPGAFATSVSLDNPHSATIAIKLREFSPQLVLNQPDDIQKTERAAYTVTRQTADSTLITSSSLVVSLQSSGTSGTFYANSSGGSPITSVTIPNGQSSASFYFTATEYANYTVSASATSFTSGTDVIALKRIEVLVTPDSLSKVYGDTDPTFTYTLSQPIAVTGSLARVTKPSVNNEWVDTYQIGLGTLASTSDDYELVMDENAPLFSITPKELSISGMSGQNKIYDGTTSATATGNANLGGVVNEDDVNISGTPVFTFAQADVGTSILISTTGYTLSGTAAGNYTVAQPTLSANITAKELTVTGLTGSNKEYDGNNTASATGTAALSGVVNSDDVSLTGTPTFTFGQNVIGTNIAITTTGYTLGGTKAGNYSLTQPSLSANITAKELIISGLTANNKTYDRTTTATTTGTATLLGVIGSENVTLSGTPSFSFSQATIGTDIDVTANGYTLAGTDVGNYTLAQPTGLKANIAAKALTIGNPTLTTSKAYDGTNTAAVTAGSLVGVVSPDAVSVSAAATYDNASVGTGKTITVVYTLSGDDAGNYTKPVDYVVTTGEITGKQLTLSGSFTVSNKTYDGNTDASIASNSLTLVGIETGDDVQIDVTTVTFATATVADTKTVSIASVTLKGDDAGSYGISLVGAPTATANITAKALTITGATAQSKQYDGTTSTTITGGTLVGVVGSDQVSIDTRAGSFANATVANNKSVTAAMTLTGTAAGNYSLTQPTGLTANITSKELTIGGSFTANNKTYDETADASFLSNSLSLVGVVSGEENDVSLDNVEIAFNNANSGTGKTVSITAADLVGTKSGNYSLSLAGAPTTTANIVGIELTLTGTMTAQGKVYDGTTTASLSGLNLSGFMTGKTDVQVSLEGTFDSANAGLRTATLSGGTLSGTDAGIYMLSLPSTLPTAQATISQKEITIGGSFTAQDKLIDGTRDASFAQNNLSLVGVIPADVANVSLTGVTIAFDDANKGDIQPVRITNASLTGSAASNYTLSLSGAPIATATINIFTYSVTGKVFEDLNGNGIFNISEPGVTAWTVTLSTSPLRTTTTNGSGNYTFENVPAGAFEVSVTPQAGYQLYQNTPAIVVVSNTSASVVNFATYRQVTLSGIVYDDTNADGSKQGDEAGKAGITISAFATGNVLAGTASTNANGEYSITGLRPGTYVLRAPMIGGLQISQPDEAGTYIINASSGSVITGRHFGYYEPISISGTIEFDEDADIDPTQIMVSGSLTNAPAKRSAEEQESLSNLPTSFSGYLDENGSFNFPNLRPGNYKILLTLPEYWVTDGPNPMTVTAQPGQPLTLNVTVVYDEEAAPLPTSGSIAGRVFADPTESGVFIEGQHSGLSGIKVSLSGRDVRDGEIKRSATTDAQGRYLFAELPEGVYDVSVEVHSTNFSTLGVNGSYRIHLKEGMKVGAPTTLHSDILNLYSDSREQLSMLTLVLDTDLNGKADTRYTMPANSVLSITGNPEGSSKRGAILNQFVAESETADGKKMRVMAPGSHSPKGYVTADSLYLKTGLAFVMGSKSYSAEEAIDLRGKVSQWPVQNVRLNGGPAQPVMLRDVFGFPYAAIHYMEIIPLSGADFGLNRADFGDAPATYGTMLPMASDPVSIQKHAMVYERDGARHSQPLSGSANRTLGSGITSEPDGKPSERADADTDDGVAMPASVAKGDTLKIDVKVNGTGFLSAWADWNGNGRFDADEKIITNLSIDGTKNAITSTLMVPAGAVEQATFVRFRFSSKANLGSTGPAPDGEVEDYMITITAAVATDDEDDQDGDDDGNTGTPTSDEDDRAGVPTSFDLGQNYPNPFNPTTVIPFDLAEAGAVNIAVYDVTGRLVKQLVNETMRAGRHTVTFNAVGIPSGVYMVRMAAGGQVITGKVTLVK